MPLSSTSCSGGVVSLAWSLEAPTERVWSAWTDPALLIQWLGEAVACDIRKGGLLVVDHGEDTLSRSEILDAEEPHRLQLTWEFPNETPSRLAITLESVDDGTLLHLVHSQLGDLEKSYEAGWMTHLSFLEAAVAGEPLPTSQFWKLHDTFRALTAVDPV